jgi:hypothetical protein
MVVSRTNTRTARKPIKSITAVSALPTGRTKAAAPAVRKATPKADALKPRPAATPAAAPAAPVKKVIRRKPAAVTADPALHPLAHLIPAPWYAEDYVSRSIGGVVDIKLIRKALSLKMNTLIEGPTGSGKTSLVYAAAAGATGELKAAGKGPDGKMQYENVIDASLRRPVVYVPCNGAIEPSQFFGRWVPTPQGTFKFAPGEITLACLYGGIIYLDEVNFMPPKIASVLHGAMDKRRTIVLLDAAGSDTPTAITLHPQTQIIATYNGGDYQGTRPMNEAFVNRFAFNFQFPYEAKQEEALVWSKHLLLCSTQLRESYTAGDIRTPVSTNMLIEFEMFAQDPDLGYNYAQENFISRFHADERPAVVKVMEAHRDNIIRDLFVIGDDGDGDGDNDDSDIDGGLSTPGAGISDASSNYNTNQEEG